MWFLLVYCLPVLIWPSLGWKPREHFCKFCSVNKSHTRPLKGWNIYAEDKAERGRDENCLLFSINSFWLFRCLLSAKYSGFQWSAQTSSGGVIQEQKFWEREEFRQKSSDSKILLLIFQPGMSLEYFQIPLVLPVERPQGVMVMWFILLEPTGYYFP